MADFGGFQTQTPQELLAQLAEQRRKVMTQGNVQQQRSQNMETALDALFGNPQVRQAKRVETRIQQATQGTKKQEGEDSLDYELRRLQGIRDAVVDVDPSVASQINQRLLELGEAKIQRERLKAHDAREVEKHNLDMSEGRDEANVRKLMGGSTYVFDTNTGTAESFDLLDPSQSAAFAEAAKKPGSRIFTRAEAAQLYRDKSLEAMKVRRALAESDGLSKVTSQRVEQASAGLLGLYATADRIFQVLEANPDVMTSASAGAKEMDKLATELGAMGRVASGGKTVEGQSIDSWLKANSITNTRAQGLIVGLAYATAKANDPSGRISDKDLAAATEMVGGNNPNPAAIVANLNDNLTANSQALFDRIDTLPEGVREQMKARREMLGKRSASFQERFEKYSQGQRGPEATGAPGAVAPSADGFVEVKPGVRVREIK